MRQESVKLDSNIYNFENIHELREKAGSENNWFYSIYQFLLNWFDETNYIIVNTSGSTGKPKEIHLSKSTMRNSARMTNEFFDLDKDKTALLCLPASYIAGKMMLVRAIVGGLNLITVEPKANPFENLKGKIDFAAITPYQLNHSISSLQSLNVQKIIVGGSAVSKQLESQLETLNTAFFETYGMTETASHIALRALNGSSKSDYFKTLNGVAIQKDNRNCLIIQAPLLIEEEIKTNDIVEIKDQNTFHWIGRFDSVINSGGVKMHPEEIEKKIEHLIQSQFFISSIPDELLGNKVILVIESKTFENKDEQILIQNIKRVVEKYEAPNLILYLDQFIYSKNNKVLKTETQRQAIKLTEDKAQKK